MGRFHDTYNIPEQSIQIAGSLARWRPDRFLIRPRRGCALHAARNRFIPTDSKQHSERNAIHWAAWMSLTPHPRLTAITGHKEGIYPWKQKTQLFFAYKIPRLSTIAVRSFCYAVFVWVAG